MKKPLILLSALFIGIALGGFLYYLETSSKLEDVSFFMTNVAIFSIIIPLALSFLSGRSFFFIISCTALILITGAITSTVLYCTYGACSEFAGLTIFITIIWIPIMIVVTSLLRLIGSRLQASDKTK